MTPLRIRDRLAAYRKIIVLLSVSVGCFFWTLGTLVFYPSAWISMTKFRKVWFGWFWWLVGPAMACQSLYTLLISVEYL
jgi:hypothetical protein